MKKESTKFMILLIALILITGTIILFVKGLAFDLKYQEAQEIELNIGKEVSISEIKEITNEVFGTQKVAINHIEIYKDAVRVISSQITDEQKAKLINKVNEKYGTEIKAESTKVTQRTHVKARDIVKPYLLPFTIVSVITIAWFMIRFHKLNFIKVLLESVGIILLAQLLLLDIMAFTRMPVGYYTMPMVIIVYMISTYICTKMFDEKLSKVIEDDKE